MNRIDEVTQNAADHIAYITTLCGSFQASLEKELNSVGRDGRNNRKNRDLFYKALKLGTADDPEALEKLYATMVILADTLNSYSADIFL